MIRNLLATTILLSIIISFSNCKKETTESPIECTLCDQVVGCYEIQLNKIETHLDFLHPDSATFTHFYDTVGIDTTILGTAVIHVERTDSFHSKAMIMYGPEELTDTFILMRTSDPDSFRFNTYHINGNPIDYNRPTYLSGYLTTQSTASTLVFNECHSARTSPFRITVNFCTRFYGNGMKVNCN